MKVKEILEQMNNTINEFVSKFGCRAAVGYDFSYYDGGIIEWSPMVLEDADNEFQNFVSNRYPHIQADTFLWSLLHEIGHHCTRYMWSNKDMDIFHETAIHLEEELQTKVDLSNVYLAYFLMKNEIVATDWAAEYMEKNSEEISEFWRKFVEDYNKLSTIE